MFYILQEVVAQEKNIKTTPSPILDLLVICLTLQIRRPSSIKQGNILGCSGDLMGQDEFCDVVTHLAYIWNLLRG